MPALVVILLANTFWAAGATAQSMSRNRVFGRYQQINWQERDGLPQNTVLAIATTRDGYLWLGTYEGAARFDGVRFTLFNPSTTTGIGNSYVTSLLERRDGDLWLATYGGGVSRLSGGRFTQYAMRDGLSSDFIWCLFEDHAGTLWIGTDGGGVNAFSRGRFTAYTIADGLPSNLVRAIVDDGNGGLLVGTNRGIARIADGRVSAYEGRADVAHADISTLARPPDGSFWVATMSGGLYRVDSHGVTEFGPDHGWTNDRVESLFADEEGRMWVGTSNRRLVPLLRGPLRELRTGRRLAGRACAGHCAGRRQRSVDWDRWRSGAIQEATRDGLYPTGRPRERLRRQHLPGCGRQRLGGDGTRLDALRERRLQGPHDERRSPGRSDQDLAISADGLPLVYTGSGLARWTGDRFVQAKDVAGIPWDRVNAVLEDRSGTLWLGIHDGGLIRVRDGHATHLTKKDGLADDSVHALFEDRQGSLWVGTLRNGVDPNLRTGR